MSDDRDERDADGNLTPWALACDALHDNGCDCDEDEPGTCLACRCEAAMQAERKDRRQALAALTAERAAHRHDRLEMDRAVAERQRIEVRLAASEAGAEACLRCTPGLALVASEGQRQRSDAWTAVVEEAVKLGLWPMDMLSSGREKALEMFLRLAERVPRAEVERAVAEVSALKAVIEQWGGERTVATGRDHAPSTQTERSPSPEYEDMRAQLNCTRQYLDELQELARDAAERLATYRTALADDARAALDRLAARAGKVT
jgi:hypothetical protein